MKRYILGDLMLSKIKTAPFFTIITVCLNEVSRIEKTCRSIVEQMSKDYEWIVIDGGSNDGTINILEKFNSNISILVSEIDSGIYNAMNNGLELAQGEYVIFLNGGDYFVNDKVLYNVAKFIRNDNCMHAIYHGWLNLVDVNNRIISSIKYNRKYKSLMMNFASGNVIPHPASFVRKELFDIYGGFDESYRIAADFEWWVRIICKFKFKDFFLNVTVSSFYIDGVSSIGNGYLEGVIEKKKILNKYFSYKYVLFRVYRKIIKIVSSCKI